VLSNKHVAVALLVAPLLSLLAWFAVDSQLSERPRSAEAGRVYPLLEKSNCRYASGVCELENADVRVELKVRSQTRNPVLQLRSSVPLQGALMALVPAAGGDDPPPEAMTRTNAGGTRWETSLSAMPAAGARIRLVASTSDNHFTAEVSTEFSRQNR